MLQNLYAVKRIAMLLNVDFYLFRYTSSKEELQNALVTEYWLY